jgi:hypothetical protein
MSKSSTVKGMGVLLLVVVVSFVAWEILSGKLR